MTSLGTATKSYHKPVNLVHWAPDEYITLVIVPLGSAEATNWAWHGNNLFNHVRNCHFSNSVVSTQVHSVFHSTCRGSPFQNLILSPCSSEQAGDLTYHAKTHT